MAEDCKVRVETSEGGIISFLLILEKFQVVLRLTSEKENVKLWVIKFSAFAH